MNSMTTIVERCVCVCMCVSICVYVDSCMHAYVACMYVYVDTRMHRYVDNMINGYVCKGYLHEQYDDNSGEVCMCVYVYVYMCVCRFIHAYICGMYVDTRMHRNVDNMMNEYVRKGYLCE